MNAIHINSEELFQSFKEIIEKHLSNNHNNRFKTLDPIERYNRGNQPC